MVSDGLELLTHLLLLPKCSDDRVMPACSVHAVLSIEPRTCVYRDLNVLLALGLYVMESAARVFHLYQLNDLFIGGFTLLN